MTDRLLWKPIDSRLAAPPESKHGRPLVLFQTSGSTRYIFGNDFMTTHMKSCSHCYAVQCANVVVTMYTSYLWIKRQQCIQS